MVVKLALECHRIRKRCRPAKNTDRSPSAAGAKLADDSFLEDLYAGPIQFAFSGCDAYAVLVVGRLFIAHPGAYAIAADRHAGSVSYSNSPDRYSCAFGYLDGYSHAY